MELYLVLVQQEIVIQKLYLDKNELRMDPRDYLMYIKLGAADSAVDAITRK